MFRVKVTYLFCNLLFYANINEMRKAHAIHFCALLELYFLVMVLAYEVNKTGIKVKQQQQRQQQASKQAGRQQQQQQQKYREKNAIRIETASEMKERKNPILNNM